MGAFTSVVKCKEVRGYFLVTLGIRYLERQNFVVKKLAGECNRNIPYKQTQKCEEIENSLTKEEQLNTSSDLHTDPSEKTETITFRLPISTIKGLRRDAQFEGVSLNTLAMRVFSNHILWEKYERKVGLLPMTKTFLQNVIEKMTDQEIVNLAEKIEKDTFKSILVFMKRERSKKEFISILRTWLSVSWMQHSLEIRDDGNYHFTIRHELGKNWSLYIKTLVSELYHDSFSDNIQIDTTSSTISIILPS